MKTLSRGQYELVRASFARVDRNQSGLSGTSAITLTAPSAGDFQPRWQSVPGSMSIALAMSDEIQAQEGGIELDVLFVDEGFGSLDADLLRHAIITLQSLGENHRLVGVISHVAELRERINRKIIVTKTIEGSSRARIEI